MGQESGSATVVLVAATAACMLLAAVFLSIAGIYAAVAGVDAAASAAAVGALRALKHPVLRAAEDTAGGNIARFWAEVNRAAGERTDQWEAEYRQRRRSELEGREPPLTPEEIDSIIDGEVAARRPGVYQSYRRSEVRARKPAIADLLLSGQPLPLTLKVREFLTPAERGCVVFRAAQENRAAMEGAAGRYARLNGAEVFGPVRFLTGDGAEVRVEVRRALSLVVYDNLLPDEARHLQASGTARLMNLAGEPMVFAPPCTARE